MPCARLAAKTVRDTLPPAGLSWSDVGRSGNPNSARSWSRSRNPSRPLMSRSIIRHQVPLDMHILKSLAAAFNRQQMCYLEPPKSIFHCPCSLIKLAVCVDIEPSPNVTTKVAVASSPWISSSCISILSIPCFSVMSRAELPKRVRSFAAPTCSRIFGDKRFCASSISPCSRCREN